MNKNAVIIFGSSRRNGHTGRLVDDIARRHSLRVVDVSDYNIAPYDYEYKNSGDDFLPLARELVTYQQWILASPVYWYTMSAQMKVFVDRWSDLLDVEKDLGRQIRGKQGAVLSTGAMAVPERSFEECFKNSFEYMGMQYDGMLYADTSNGYQADAYESAITSFGKNIL